MEKKANPRFTYPTKPMETGGLLKRDWGSTTNLKSKSRCFRENVRGSKSERPSDIIS